MKSLRTGLLLAMLLLSPLCTAANSSAPSWYAVELIVFRYTDPQAGSLETWPANPGSPDWNSAVALTSPDANPALVPFQELPASSYRMDNVWQKLKRSHDYEPLLHIAWMQPSADRSTAPAVRIGVPPVSTPPAMSVPAAASAAVAAAAGENATPVYGTAKLSTTGPYLHFDLDMIYRGALLKTGTPGVSQPLATASPQFQWYRLAQDRRIDAGRMNYFDQPLFGVLLLVTPLK
ncbi:MAG: hypothetical protein KGJ56_02700 [Gammaproteobacteria bacterium]|nr:hypothetical protein [Gammaproteobacteria bacterium]